ncbi:MAG TPA: hypothetical protein VFM37_17550 [Pseudonocardiaceae bacterium]|nr:hypothetical protein [Pseudonocardiaceae bacterium]
MELWRVVGAGVIGVGGLVLMMVAVAQARDAAALRTRRGGRGPVGPVVLRTSLLGLAVVAVTIVGVLTVLPQLVVWTLSALIWLVVGVIILAD